MAIQLDPVPKKTAQHQQTDWGWTVERLPRLQKAKCHTVPGMAVHAWDLSSWEVEAARLEFKAILSHTARPPGAYEVWACSLQCRR